MSSSESHLQRRGCGLRYLLTTAILVCVFKVAAGDALASSDETPPATVSIPFNQLGAVAQKQYPGDGSGIKRTATGAKMRAVLQDLDAEATTDGLWLTSTADEDLDKPNRFRLSAASMGRETSVALPPEGSVRVGKDLVSWVRLGLVEEYRVSGDGVRQDFVVLERPEGEGELGVVMEMVGLRAEAAAYGARLTVEATGRELAYHKLHVSDASGRELSARMEVLDSGRLAVRIDDAEAVYPVRIDPTFSDADWVALNPNASLVRGDIYALTMDGSGNLYVGGDIHVAVGLEANGIAKWNGSAWSALGSGVNGSVCALAVDGSGNVYAGGTFSTAGGMEAKRIAKWNGSEWSALGSGLTGPAYALAVDGNGNLYAGGWFTTAGGVVVWNVATWNGTAWSALQSGVTGRVDFLAVDGSGNLYAGGAGGITKWNGSTWSALGTGMNGSLHAMAVDGSGNLYAGGWFTVAGGVAARSVAKWDGSAWSALGSGVEGRVDALAVDSSGNLYAGAWLPHLGRDGVLKWNGSVWSDVLGGGVGNGGVKALAVDSSGNLYAGGSFAIAGDVDVNGLAKWNGSAWSIVGTGLNAPVYALAVDRRGNLYASGGFDAVPQGEASFIVKWNGSAWSALGSGLNRPAYALAVDGKGNLYAGGDFTAAGGVAASHIAKWNGAAWSALGSGVNGPISALAMDGKDNLYAGGDFGTAGGVAASHIAKWNGSTWSALGSGVNGSVEALAVDGRGNLYAGGWFTVAGGVAARCVAKWSGSEWSALGLGLKGAVLALAVDGSGNLYAGGYFNATGGVQANSVAKWNGSAWSALSSGLNSIASALAVDSRGNLYAGGAFNTAGGVAARCIAKWNGSSWSPLGSGMNGQVTALVVADGDKLYVGGEFVGAGDKISPYLAQLNRVGEIDPSFRSTQPIQIPSIGNAKPYPTTVKVSKLASATKLVVRVKGFSHDSPGDVDMFLMAPNGQVCSLLSDAGASSGVSDLDLIFDDNASSTAPDTAALGSASYRPTDHEPGEPLPPGGVGTIGTSLQALLAGPVNGTWKLFVSDDSSGNGGSIASWGLTFEIPAEPEIAVEQPAKTDLVDGAATVDFGNVAAGKSVKRTFTVRSVGTTPLQGLAVGMTGVDAGDFTVEALKTTSLAAGRSATFKVMFKPTAAGARTAALHITSNDEDESPFDIELTGNGLGL